MILVKKNFRAKHAVLLMGFVVLNLCFWFYSRTLHASWANVPPAPNASTSSSVMLGDVQMSYRVWSIIVQNLGEYGGRSRSFEEYNYDRLVSWLGLLSFMDPNSNIAPFLASYYFSNVKDKEKLRATISYLGDIDQFRGEEKWRWLAQAITLARFDLKDTDLALELAYKLADIRNPSMPAWTEQMPAFILRSQGNKTEAFNVMMETLQGSVDHMHPAEIYFTQDYICSNLLEDSNKAGVQFCDSL